MESADVEPAEHTVDHKQDTPVDNPMPLSEETQNKVEQTRDLQCIRKYSDFFHILLRKSYSKMDEIVCFASSTYTLSNNDKAKQYICFFLQMY
jgi:hypothetical protein